MNAQKIVLGRDNPQAAAGHGRIALLFRAVAYVEITLNRLYVKAIIPNHALNVLGLFSSSAFQ